MPRLRDRRARPRTDSRGRRRELDHGPHLRRVARRNDPERGRHWRGRLGWRRRRCPRWWWCWYRRLARHGRSNRRQEAQRVEVTLRIAAEPDPELHVRDRVGRHPARADDRDPLALGDDRPRGDQKRAEMQKRDGVVRRLDRDREPIRRDPAGERHPSRNRREHRIADRALDVDPAMLPGDERVLLVEGKPLQHRPGNRPRPGAGRGGRCECKEHRDRHEPGESRSVLSVLQTDFKVPGRPGRCQIGLQRAAIERVARGSGQPRDDLGRLPPGHSRFDQLGDRRCRLLAGRLKRRRRA